MARAQLQRQVAQLPTGEPYLCGVPSSFPLVIRCAACRRRTTYTALQFTLLPEVTVEQLERLGHLEALTKDWRGAGLEPAQARDLVAARIMGPASPMPQASRLPASKKPPVRKRRAPKA